jgi:hypothetical protein
MLCYVDPLGDPRIRIDFSKFGWVGVPSVGAPMCMVMGFPGLKTLEDVLKYGKPLKVGATRAGSTGHDLPLILNKTLGTKFKVISGYTGTATTRVALQKQELEAVLFAVGIDAGHRTFDVGCDRR